MRAMVIVNTSSSAQRYLVRLFTDALVNEVRNLINEKRHADAVRTVFTSGIFEREILDEEVPRLEADLVLSENNAYWDVAK